MIIVCYKNAFCPNSCFSWHHRCVTPLYVIPMWYAPSIQVSFMFAKSLFLNSLRLLRFGKFSISNHDIATQFFELIHFLFQFFFALSGLLQFYFLLPGALPRVITFRSFTALLLCGFAPLRLCVKPAKHNQRTPLVCGTSDPPRRKR